jgi:hypothetical protein
VSEGVAGGVLSCKKRVAINNWIYPDQTTGKILAKGVVLAGQFRKGVPP